MAWVEYVATEAIMPGHVASVSYAFEFQITQDDPIVEDLVVDKRSLSGYSERLYFGWTETRQVRMFPTPELEMALVREFLHSTADGQVFVFDPYGRLDQPGQPMSVVRADTGYAPRRVNVSGRPLYDDYKEISFTVRRRL